MLIIQKHIFKLKIVSDKKCYKYMKGVIRWDYQFLDMGPLLDTLKPNIFFSQMSFFITFINAETERNKQFKIN